MTPSIISESKHHAKSSDIVAYVHHRLHPRRLFEGSQTFKVSEKVVHRVEDFMHRHRLWVYCRKVMIIKKDHGVDRSFLEIKEELIQKLIQYKRTHRDELDAHSRQMVHIEKVIKKCEERKIYFSKQLERYQSQGVERNEESVERLEARLREFKEELEFREHVLSVQKELAANKFLELSEMEKNLFQLEQDYQIMLESAAKEASMLNIPESIALTLFNYIINDGYFTYIPEEEWGLMMSNINAKEQTRVKDHFEYNAKKVAYLIKDEQCYFSPIQREYLVGDKSRSGISFMDFQVKKILNEQLSSLSFQSYLNEVKSFYRYLVNEALADGVLTIEEMSMLDETAVALKLKVKSSHEILNDEALKIQRNVINEQMVVFYDLAMADGVMQRNEAKFLVEMNQKLDRLIVNKIGDVMASRKFDLRLHLNSEDMFVDMCKMVMKDGVLDEKECQILMEYTQKQGWKKCKLQPILIKAVNGVN